MSIRAYDQSRILSGSCGGFLNPPGHPEHTLHVETGPKNDPNGFMSLSAAIEAEYVNPAVRNAARSALDRWEREKLPIDAPEVIEWTRSVLGYFRNCYKGNQTDETTWHASNMRISRDDDPMANVDSHAGVNLIRKYYPEFQPTTEDFATAKWGK